MIAIRIILLILPLVLVLYYLRRRYLMKKSGQEVSNEDLKTARVILLAVIGSLLVLVVTFSYFDTKSTQKDKIYIPPEVVDGKVVPGHFIDKDDVNKEETPEHENEE